MGKEDLKKSHPDFNVDWDKMEDWAIEEIESYEKEVGILKELHVPDKYKKKIDQTHLRNNK